MIIIIKAAPVAGWFFPGNTTDQHNEPMMPPNDYPHWLANEQGGEGHNNSLNILYDGYVDPTCVSALGPNASWHCGSVHNAFQFIKAPVFVMQNKYDTNQLYAQLGLPKQNELVNNETTEFVEYFGTDMDRSILPQLVMNGESVQNGLFYASCFDHTNGLGIGGKPSTMTSVNGYNSSELVGDWFWERNALPHYVYDTCNEDADNELPCNPTCSTYP